MKTRTIPDMNYKQIKRFYDKIEESSTIREGMTTPCRVWCGATYSNGYGQLALYNIHFQAHRISYFLNTGIDPGEKLVLHKCNNKLCTNIDHLFLGTHSDNMVDAWKSGIRKPRDIRYRDELGRARSRDVLDDFTEEDMIKFYEKEMRNRK